MDKEVPKEFWDRVRVVMPPKEKTKFWRIWQNKRADLFLPYWFMVGPDFPAQLVSWDELPEEVRKFFDDTEPWEWGGGGKPYSMTRVVGRKGEERFYGFCRVRKGEGNG